MSLQYIQKCAKVLGTKGEVRIPLLHTFKQHQISLHTGFQGTWQVGCSKPLREVVAVLL